MLDLAGCSIANAQNLSTSLIRHQSDSPPRRFRSLYKTTTPVAVRALSEGQDESGTVSIRRGDRMTERLAVKTDALGPPPCRKSMGTASGVAPGRIALIPRPTLPSGLPTGFYRWFCCRNCGWVVETVAGGFLKVQQANPASY